MDRSSLVVVALPSENDLVRKVSSEKEPHLTLLYLGKPDYDQARIDHIVGYIEHAAKDLRRFSLEVDGRGELGEDHADVLFFYKDSAKLVETFRENLLKDPLISAAYHSEDQFPEWLPHLTMGYPETPAKKSTQESEFVFVEFDRIALWTGDSTGPTIPLERFRYDMEVAMSDLTSSRYVVDDIIKHYGVKGMKWGVRRSQSERSASASAKPAASEDALRAAAARSKANAGGVKALSTKELQDLTQRMNLEQQYSSMLAKEPTKITRGQEHVKKTLSLAKTAQDVYNVVNSPAGKALRKVLIGV